MPSSGLPRAKPVPVPKPPTKWDLFAAEKGLQKRKKSRHTFDEQVDDWVPRHGYKVSTWPVFHCFCAYCTAVPLFIFYGVPFWPCGDSSPCCLLPTPRRPALHTAAIHV